MEKIQNLLEKLNEYMKSELICGTITYRSEQSHMVRCGRSQISLNVSETGEKFFFDLQEGKRRISGSTTAGVEDYDKLKAFARELYSKISFMPEVDYLTPLNSMAQGDYKCDDSDPELAKIDSAVMVSLFKSIGDHFADKDVEISGAFSAGDYSYAVINTNVDQAVSYRGSDFNVEAVVQMLDQDKKELRAAAVGEKLNTFSPQEIINELDALYTLKASTQRVDIEPGEYDVVFSADAFAELTEYMGYLTIYGGSYEYQTGMLQKDTHKPGTQLFADNVTITDAPDDEDILFRRNVGMNGIDRTNFPLIENGVLKQFIYSDKDTCDRFGKVINNDSSVASLKVENGDGPSSFSEVIASCKRPTLYISFIHYMNFTNPSKGEFTGSSRFGTFLIEDGEIKNHLYNQRINDSFHRIFNNIAWLSEVSKNINTSNTYGMRRASAIRCPKYVKVKAVKITGSSASK